LLNVAFHELTTAGEKKGEGAQLRRSHTEKNPTTWLHSEKKGKEEEESNVHALIAYYVIIANSEGKEE